MGYKELCGGVHTTWQRYRHQHRPILSVSVLVSVSVSVPRSVNTPWIEKVPQSQITVQYYLWHMELFVVVVNGVEGMQCRPIQVPLSSEYRIPDFRRQQSLLCYSSQMCRRATPMPSRIRQHDVDLHNMTSVWRNISVLWRQHDAMWVRFDVSTTWSPIVWRFCRKNRKRWSCR